MTELRALPPLPETAPLMAPESFRRGLEELGLDASDTLLEPLGSFLARLLAMNEHMNLTAITSPEEAWHKHVLDALTLLPWLRDLPAKTTLCDVGSGGGVPGIPIAIARPDLHVTLVEATLKKAAFLEETGRALGLGNLTVVPQRAEALASSALAGGFAVVTARAVAALDKLLPLTAPLLEPHGRLLLIKGQRAAEELASARRLLGKLRLSHEGTTVTPTGRILRFRKS